MRYYDKIIKTVEYREVFLRREDREIVSKEEIESIISKAVVLRIAFANENKPYIVPVNFGYHNDTFYFHCASEGKKLEMIKNNPCVAYELEGETKLIKGDIPCEFTMAYESVIGTGIASIVQETQDKINGLNQLMHQYSNDVELEYKEDLLKRIIIVKIEVDEMTGKKSKWGREMNNKIRIKNVRKIKELKYLKSYAIDYYDGNNNEKIWELVSRQGIQRLKNEIYDQASYTDGVMIFATNIEQNKVVLLKEFRVSAGKFVYTIPAGLIDSEESIEESAVREFKEETGLSFDLKQVDQERYTSVGIINEKVNIVYGYYSGTPTKVYQEASEYAEIKILNKAEVKSILKNEEVTVRTALLLKSFFNLNTFFNHK